MDNIDETKRRLEANSNEKLLAIVTEDRAEYQPEVVRFAEAKLQERGIEFEVPDAKTEPTKEELLAEITRRLGEGEDLGSIKPDFEQRGLAWPMAGKQKPAAIKAANPGKKGGMGGGSIVIGMAVLVFTFAGLVWMYP